MTRFAPIPRPNPVDTPSYVAVTMRLSDASSDVLTRQVRLLRDCVALSQQRWGFDIKAAVVLPNEIQILSEFLDVDLAVSGAVRLIKSAFALHSDSKNPVTWDEEDEIAIVAGHAVALRKRFIEEAPVRAGLCETAQDWPFSSAHQPAQSDIPLSAAVA